MSDINIAKTIIESKLAQTIFNVSFAKSGSVNFILLVLQT